MTLNWLTPISPPLVKATDLLRPVVESRRRATRNDNRRIYRVPFQCRLRFQRRLPPQCGADPNTY